ncbi:hypothetical protein P8891_21290 [Bacillus atrophaeus]|uniref:hypothetical protein n=1 Tax=Bacillus atrophaeus TaxID=1452 RepID=UPI00227EE5D8|nr:hypothetical protein [Bacillus atrophaeus]MCY7946884.1 hypothetical protein [Bacillus atrophaeus]MCY8098202.1 hypothetical protein [Bacillus atrophaeus]MCY9170544.1 hypothetical protein [Bacillus atrophaeus]MEC0743503.1 hypothetical protein [Bacillus atrophaeus]MEC0747748.1 hypothetical protein [Bacillus atrophaeus]
MCDNTIDNLYGACNQGKLLWQVESADQSHMGDLHLPYEDFSETDPNEIRVVDYCGRRFKITEQNGQIISKNKVK